MRTKVKDLRSGLELLSKMDGQLLKTDIEVMNFQEYIVMLVQAVQ